MGARRIKWNRVSKALSLSSGRVYKITGSYRCVVKNSSWHGVKYRGIRRSLHLQFSPPLLPRLPASGSWEIWALFIFIFELPPGVHVRFFISLSYHSISPVNHPHELLPVRSLHRPAATAIGHCRGCLVYSLAWVCKSTAVLASLGPVHLSLLLQRASSSPAKSPAVRKGLCFTCLLVPTVSNSSGPEVPLLLYAVDSHYSFSWEHSAISFLSISLLLISFLTQLLNVIPYPWCWTYRDK